MHRKKRALSLGLLLALGATGAAVAGATPLPAPAWRPVVNIAAGPGPDPAALFTSLAAQSPTSAWAFESTSSTTTPIVAWRLQGARWARVSVPEHDGTSVFLSAVSTAAGVYAVTNRGEILKWTLRAWKPIATFADVNGLAVTGPGDVWVAGRRTSARASFGLWHLTAGTWHHVSSVSYGALDALSDTTLFSTTRTQLAEFDGTRWTLTSLAALLPAKRFLCELPGLTGVEALTPTDVWVTASGGCQDFGGPFRLLHGVDGAWSIAAIRPDLSSGEPYAAGGGGLWITTDTGEGSSSVMLRLSAGTLSEVPLPRFKGGLELLGVATGPGSSEAFAFGWSGRYSSTQQALVLQYRP